MDKLETILNILGFSRKYTSDMVSEGIIFHQDRDDNFYVAIDNQMYRYVYHTDYVFTYKHELSSSDIYGYVHPIWSDLITTDDDDIIIKFMNDYFKSNLRKYKIKKLI